MKRTEAGSAEMDEPAPVDKEEAGTEPNGLSQAQEKKKVAIRVYKKRWIMLFLFVATSTFNAIHWLQYSIIANIAMKYYEVSALAVNWSSMIYMVIYVPLVFPATFVLEKKGLRFSLILGLTIMCCGAWLKLVTLNRNMFVVAFVAQGIVGGAQIFILSVPARLASIWFDAKEVSTACALGVFGNQLGVALGFVIPPEVVHDSNDMDAIREGFKWLYIGFAVPPTVLLFLVILFFEAAPKFPPSLAQVNIRENIAARTNSDVNGNSYIQLVKNKDFILLLFSYGVNVGVFYAYSTLLNQLYLSHYPKGEVTAGYIGLVMIIGGMIGSVVWGIFLDRTHKFKLTTIVVYCFAYLGMMAFTFSLFYEQNIAIFVSSGILGFFMNGYLTVAYEFTSELTYPVPESTSTGVLNAVGELLGLSMVLVYGMILDYYDDLITNLSMSSILLVGLVVSLFISGKSLKRHGINKEQSQSM
ncbi:uncharacterized MFS-type transporter C09D4.1-like isoform X2 [Cimex lectularius]|uniref:Major facilitator superfamily (MFS) profile domain-containing protein n=1 Tax=Cimex lectularius TaxID=79782 RepID=A0A8I6SUA7_CIMLE|nr:uncharacterized MFS-type transporter C09D4.1-like isoform X2 [Cimex lectularius]